MQNSTSTHPITRNSIFLRKLKDILNAEAHTILYAIEHLPTNCHKLIDIILNTSGKLILTGMGKSGHIAQKLAATFSSTGTPACFLHPAEAMHGDLGLVQPNDTIIMLSKSGSGSELEKIATHTQTLQSQSILICCNDGPLTNHVNIFVKLPFKKEACHLQLAPTSSSTLMLAFGDAVALTVSKYKNYSQKDFARVHPFGMLGKKLLLSVNDLMHTDKALALLAPEISFKDLMINISSKKFGVGIVVDKINRLLGIITDGDLRRACNNYGKDVFDRQAHEIMTTHPSIIEKNILAQTALELMEEKKITSLVVVENNKVVGLLHIHDILSTGLSTRKG